MTFPSGTWDLLSGVSSPDSSLPGPFGWRWVWIPTWLWIEVLPRRGFWNLVQPLRPSDSSDSAGDQYPRIHQLGKGAHISLKALFDFFSFFPNVSDLFQQRVHLWYPKSLLIYPETPAMKVQREISYQYPYYSSLGNDEAPPICLLGYFLLTYGYSLGIQCDHLYASSCSLFLETVGLLSLPLTRYDPLQGRVPFSSVSAWSIGLPWNALLLFFSTGVSDPRIAGLCERNTGCVSIQGIPSSHLRKDPSNLGFKGKMSSGDPSSCPFLPPPSPTCH